MVTLILCICFIVLGAIAVTLFLIEKVRKYSLKATMIKAFSSLLFIGVSAVGLYIHGGNALALFVTLGLLLGLLGDIWLDFKYVYPESDVPYTYAGFFMFLFGHVVYISGMIREYYHGENPLWLIVPFVVGVLFGFLTVILEKPMKVNYGKMKWICILYGIALFSMMSVAISLCIMNQFQYPTIIMMAAGGVFFAISDLILSGTYFGEGKERPIDIISNGITYYMAQFLIAFSVYFI